MGDDGGGRRDAHGQDVVPQDRVDHGRLAVIELPEHDERDAPVGERLEALLSDLTCQGLQAALGRDLP